MHFSLIILHLFYDQKVDAVELIKVSMSVLRKYQSFARLEMAIEAILKKFQGLKVNISRQSEAAHLNSDNWTTGISLLGE